MLSLQKWPVICCWKNYKINHQTKGALLLLIWNCPLSAPKKECETGEEPSGKKVQRDLWIIMSGKSSIIVEDYAWLGVKVNNGRYYWRGTIEGREATTTTNSNQRKLLVRQYSDRNIFTTNWHWQTANSWFYLLTFLSIVRGYIMMVRCGIVIVHLQASFQQLRDMVEFSRPNIYESHHRCF